MESWYIKEKQKISGTITKENSNIRIKYKRLILWSQLFQFTPYLARNVVAIVAYKDENLCMEGINFDVVEEKWLNTYPVLETMSELIFQPQLLGQKEKAED